MPVSSDSGETVKVAGLARRVTARAIDALCMLMLCALVLAAVAVVMALGVLAVQYDFLSPDGSGVGFVMLFLLLWAPSTWMVLHLYEVVSTARCGQTFGKRLMGICVIRCLDPGGIVVEAARRDASTRRWAIPHGAAAAAVILSVVVIATVGPAGLTDSEFLLLLLPFFAFGAGCYISALFDSERRGWHDKAAGTIVIRATDDVLERLSAPKSAAREPWYPTKSSWYPPESWRQRL